MAAQDCQTPQNEKSRSKSSAPAQNGQTREGLLSPGFRTAAAMAGWDEEALLLAALVVEDTPERVSKQKKRSLSRTSLILSSDSRTWVCRSLYLLLFFLFSFCPFVWLIWFDVICSESGVRSVGVQFWLLDKCCLWTTVKTSLKVPFCLIDSCFYQFMVC